MKLLLFSWKTTIVAAVTFLTSIILIFNDVSIFGKLETITSQVRTNKVVTVEKFLFAPSECDLSVNGWVADSQGLGSDVVLNFGEYYVTLSGAATNDKITFTTVKSNELKFRTGESGNLKVSLNKIEDPGSVYDHFNVNLYCKNYVSKGVGVSAFLALFISSLYLLIFGVRSLFRAIALAYSSRRDTR